MPSEVPQSGVEEQVLGASLKQLEGVNQATSKAAVFEGKQVESLKPVRVRKGPDGGDEFGGSALNLFQ